MTNDEEILNKYFHGNKYRVLSKKERIFDGDIHIGDENIYMSLDGDYDRCNINYRRVGFLHASVWKYLSEFVEWVVDGVCRLRVIKYG